MGNCNSWVIHLHKILGSKKQVESVHRMVELFQVAESIVWRKLEGMCFCVKEKRRNTKGDLDTESEVAGRIEYFKSILLLFFSLCTTLYNIFRWYVFMT